MLSVQISGLGSQSFFFSFLFIYFFLFFFFFFWGGGWLADFRVLGC